MEEEEVPSTSGVREQTPGVDENVVVIPDSESSSGEEGERLQEPPPPPQKGKKRKRRRNDDASGTAPSQPAGPPQVELGALEEFGGQHPQSLARLLHAFGATSLHPDTRGIYLFFGSRILTTQTFLAYAMAVRQAIRDRREIQATIKSQISWKLTTTASRWRMGYRKYSGWMYSYSDDERRPIRIDLCVTFACEEGKRCNVSFSAGTFKPVRASNYDMVWLTTQRCVGELVDLCARIYRPFFGYLCIFRCLKFIWENVLLPEQRVPFMQFLGFLQQTDNIYLKRLIQEGLHTSNIETPWLSENPERALEQGWTSALIRGRVLGLSGLGPAEEPDEDATGETQQEAEDMESDDEDEIPRIVSREEPKGKDGRPPQFLTRIHRLILERTGGLTLRARKALEGPREQASGVPRRRRECAPDPPLTTRDLHILAGMFREQFKGVQGPPSQTAHEAQQTSQAPHVSPPPLASGVEILSPRAAQDLEPGPVQSPEPGPIQSPEPVPTPAPAPTGPFVRPWEVAPSQAPKAAPATHVPDFPTGAPDPIPALFPSLTLLPDPAPETSRPVQLSVSYAAPSWAPTPVQPVVPIPVRCVPPQDPFAGYSSRVWPQRYPYTLPVPGQAPEIPMGAVEASLFYPAMQAETTPVIRPPPRLRVRAERLTQWPSSSQSPRTVRACLAMMRSGALGRPPRGSDTETWLERQVSRLRATGQLPTASGVRMPTGASAFQVQGQARAPTVPPVPLPHVLAPVSRPIGQQAPVIPASPQPPPMPGRWVFVPDQETLHGAYRRTPVSQSPSQMGAFVPVSGVEFPPPEPTDSQAPVFFGVTQYNLDQASFDVDIEDVGSAEGSEASDSCAPIDLSIHGRPIPRTPEVIVVEGEDDQNVSGMDSGVVLVSAMVHSSQGADLPDLEDPPDNEE
ncbi:EBNA-3A [macacine gammaherpesvirus 10]|uniref:EBNA-3A n=1 Tax=macacine gammaherpesvirus 10 TaxID=2560569 RepID=A0A0S0DY22_9GAMA|nr:EBNA-3A [macacine gammaherpesvirus 10]ALF03211.1 EBNA-3A [macacine gammaherpesvirus 10]